MGGPVSNSWKIAELNPNTLFQVKYYDEALRVNCGIVEYLPDYFPIGEYDNMAIVEYDDESKEIKIIKTAYFESSEDAPEIFNASIAQLEKGTFVHYSNLSDYRRFIDKLSKEQENEYFKKWYVFAGGDLEEK